MTTVDRYRPERRNARATAKLALVRYPSSDGKPMAETERHANAIIDARHTLRRRFSDREDVYVGIDMLLYYVEGDPHKSVVPDVFVVFGVPKLPPRDNWLVWREGKAPDFVLEVTSRHTRRRDEGPKRELYRCLGVAEYWQYDPTGDYLDPRLKGARLTAGEYRPIPAAAGSGGIRCASRLLGLELRLANDALRFFDPARRKYLATPDEEGARTEASLRRVAELEAALREAALRNVQQ